MNLFAVLVLELDILRAGEILSQKVGRTGLQCLAILHERLDREGADSAWESLAGRLLPLDNRHGHEVLREVSVQIENPHCLLVGFRFGGMDGVPFLP